MVKPHLDQLFLRSKFPNMINFWSKNKGKLIYNSSNVIISKNFNSKKVDQDEVFHYKDVFHFFLEWPKYYTNVQNIIFRVTCSTSSRRI